MVTGDLIVARYFIFIGDFTVTGISIVSDLTVTGDLKIDVL